MFASLFIPHFPVQALVRSEPELLGKAIAVVDGAPPLLQVVAVNPAASTAGVELGMARLKVEHFFAVAVRQRSAPREISAHAALLDCAKAFSPRVEDSTADTVVIDLDGLDRLFGSHAEIAAQIFDQTLLVGLQPHIAVACNPDAAIYAARGFSGILVIPPGSERQRLAELPLQVLSPDPKFVATLQRWGIRTLGRFADLPSTKVSERLGQEGVRLQALARGSAARPLHLHQDTLRFVETMELDHAIVLLQPLMFVVERLLEQVCRRLKARNRATHELRLTLDDDERTLRLPLPVCDPVLLGKLLALDIESHPPPHPVEKVRVEAIPTRPRTVQNGLFVPLAPEAEKLELTLARIAHLVGAGNVGSPGLLDTHRPDAFRIDRFVAAADGRRPAPRGGLGFRQFRPGLEARVQLREGVPVWIAFHGMYGPIRSASGPWNTSGDWWRDDHWAREEWDAGIESPLKGFAMYRIYLDTASGRWFADGVYD